MRRARFLETSGSLIVYFSLAKVADAQPASRPANPDVDSWIAIDARGNVAVSWGKVELGTGVDTAILQLAADQLDVPLDRVRLTSVSTATPNQGYTAGSQTLTSGATPVIQAAAVAREMLLNLAAQRFSVRPEELQTSKGYVFVTNDRNKRVGYGELVGGRKLDARIPTNPLVRPHRSGKIAGSSVPRSDIPAKLDGTYLYVQDVRVPGMLHARVVYPPRRGAKLQGYDETSLRGIPEKVRVVRKDDFLAVVATEEWHAVEAQRRLKVTWQGGEDLPAMTELAHAVLTTPGSDRTLLESGDVDGAIRSAKKVVNAQYNWPFQSHGSIGPSCAVADVRADRATVWSPTQGVFPLRGAIAQLLDMPADAVQVHYVEGSGCYGQNGADDASGAAALISKLVGRPVRVQYSREDETKYDPKGPAMVMQFRGGLDGNGDIAAWEYRLWSPTHSGRPDGRAGNLLAGIYTGAPEAPIAFVGGDRNAPNNYKIPAQRITITDQKTAVLRQSALRGLGGTQNTFGNESFMDELARAAGADPFDFRLKHLTGERGRAVLEAIRSDYHPGRGVAFVRYENRQAIVAAVADVSVDRKNGVIRVNHVWIAHDCGFVVNPDGLRNQIEGNVLQGTSRALLEQVEFGRSGVSSVDWNSYRILRFKDVPAVTIRIVNRPYDKILGAGEATTTVIAPAIANAVFAQTGARLRTVPFTPQAVKSALQALPRSPRSAARERLPAT